MSARDQPMTAQAACMPVRCPKKDIHVLAVHFATPLAESRLTRWTGTLDLKVRLRHDYNREISKTI